MSERRLLNVESTPGTPVENGKARSWTFTPYGTYELPAPASFEEMIERIAYGDAAYIAKRALKTPHERQIELLEELLDGWDWAVGERGSEDDKPVDDQIRAEVKELIAKLKSGELKITNTTTELGR